MSSKIEIVGIDPLKQKLGVLQTKLDDLSPIMLEIGKIIQTKAELSIKTQKSATDGTPYAPLSPKTVSSYARGYGKRGSKKYTNAAMGKKILIDTGALSRITVTADSKSVEVGTNATAKGYAYPVVHQFGSTKKNIPARPFLPITANKELEEATLKKIMDYLNKQILEARL